LYIAEISANHLGSLERAHVLIDAAVDAGATAIKFQTYTPDTMTLDLPTLKVSENHSLWGGRTLYDLYQEAMTPWEWHPELFAHCRERGVQPFSSPFDPSAVHFLESLEVSMYKIASLETSDHQLIQMVAQTGKPGIISTGATELSEIADIVEIYKKAGNDALTLLVCTSSYPAKAQDANLHRIHLLKKEFGVSVGLSDHTLGIGVSMAAIALGAEVIEKHFTLRRADGGADAAFSMEPEEFAFLVQEGNKARVSLGSGDWKFENSELESRRLRRSLYIVENVSKGDPVTMKNVRAIRPGLGISPKYLDGVVGKTFADDFQRGTPLTFDLIS
jgi:N-acetylneuraminate synthase